MIILDFLRHSGFCQSFNNIYVIKAKISANLDLCIYSAQDKQFNWINGSNCQFEAVFQIIQINIFINNKLYNSYSHSCSY